MTLSTGDFMVRRLFHPSSLMTHACLFGLTAWCFSEQIEVELLRGRYLGKPLVTHLGGHEYRVEKRFSFVDPWKLNWSVPAGTVVDGASIPRPLWSLVGGPWDGDYTDASIVHDYYCSTRSRGHKSVHETFFYAMLTSGVAVKKAKIMYYAVSRFGPRWERHAVNATPPAVTSAVPRQVGWLDLEDVPPLPPGEVTLEVQPDFDADEMRAVAQEIGGTKISFAELVLLAEKNYENAFQRAKWRAKYNGRAPDR